MIYHKIIAAAGKGENQLAVLIDPDKTDQKSLGKIAGLLEELRVDFIFVGGSLLTQDHLEPCLEYVSQNTTVPVVLFPGNSLQISNKADGILLLSLISGRNPELLIGNHVIAAPVLKNSGLEIIPTGYMLIESGKLTSVMYMSNTNPIPADKTDIAQCTAMAGEMLGLKLIYMDAGSGAEIPVSQNMISAVKSTISLPLIIGGGIRSAQDAKNAWEAGADLIVIGNALEKRLELIEQVCFERDSLNRIKV
jgi:phosphoglycerol geranylgeranyltransferase